MPNVLSLPGLLATLPGLGLPLAELPTDPLNAAEAGPLIFAGVLLSLVVIYLASKLGGELCARLNLPPVLGELVGGVVVGISVLHLLVFPEAGATAEPGLLADFLQQTTGISSTGAIAVAHSYSEVISVLSELGVVILLFEIGLESDLAELLKVGPQAAVVAIVGVAAPFTAGTLGLISLFAVPIIPAIFAGAALTATSIGITAKVLAEIQRLSSKEGQIIIGAAVLDDILGIIVLAVVGSLAKTGEVEISNVVYLVISSVIFMVGAIVLGRFLSPFFVALVDRLQTRGNLLIVALIFAFVLSYIAVIIHLEAILGAFTAGLVLAETDKKQALEKQVLPVADMLVPIFFVCVGAKTDISVLNPLVPENWEGLIIASFLMVVAILGKVVTGFVVFGQPGINRLAIGVGMIPRGEVGLIFAAVGSASGVLSKSLDAAIIVMVVLTTFIAPPLLRLVFKDDDGTSIPEVLQPAEGESFSLTAETELQKES
ncbi:MAG: cation:proton antiporter [Aphanocapsa sp. GSE-SYN-MK-11-07L]|jgi:Kef-type K+ transport system membrane component KefB|nr:cation:proton antiporter [Aphanocapsa sp. GSE-SYN-MK-11-07L]